MPNIHVLHIPAVREEEMFAVKALTGDGTFHPVIILANPKSVT
jgi:hypothetical protein